jgi:hypothetical protein
MTPTAVTPAARTKRTASPHPSTPRPTHRTPRQRSTVPRTPRRVSGPPSRVTAPTRSAPQTAPRRSPRVVAPRRPPRVAAPAQTPLRARALTRLRTLPDHSLLDRVVRGRLWIPLLGVLLVGIVAMQVEVLKLNASIGHSMTGSAQLQSDNQLLRADDSRLSDDQGIETEAVRLGMSMPAATQTLFLGGSTGANLSRALANIHAPDPTTFTAQTSQTAARRAAAVVSSSGQ